MSEEKVGVGGAPGAHTEAWQTVSYELGDEAADLVCGWADLCADPRAAVDGALSVLRLSGSGQDRAAALNEHMLNVDPDAYVRAFQASCA